MKHALNPLARSLRASATVPERLLWNYLRQRPFGHKFRRQVPIDTYIVDFASFSARLVIEVDGEFHADQASDVSRDERLRELGWEVARYWNKDVQCRISGVVEDIEQRLAARR